MTTGMRTFLYGLLELIKTEKIENTEIVSTKISDGIATYLYSKYKCEFDSVGFNLDNLECINEYYKSYSGIDGTEGIYRCNKKDGIYFLIKLALNEIK